MPLEERLRRSRWKSVLDDCLRRFRNIEIWGRRCHGSVKISSDNVSLMILGGNGIALEGGCQESKRKPMHANT